MASAPSPNFYIQGGRASTPRMRYTAVDSTTDPDAPVRTPSPSTSTGLYQPRARPPPSSFAFPFQAYPGNPDPGMSIPGYTSRRRSSTDSVSSYRDPPTNASATALTMNRRRRASSASITPPDELSPPNAPFMATSNASGTNSGTTSETNSLHHSPSSNSLYKASAAAAAGSLPRNSSTHSFRAAFLSPASRPSSTIGWTPPAYAQFTSVDPSASSSALAFPLAKTRAPMASTRLSQPLTPEDKPWTLKRQPYTYTSYSLTLVCIFLGLCGAAALCYFGYTSVNILPDNRLCLLMDDSFAGDSLNSDYWNVEVQTGGFGNGEFQMTTNSPENLFIRNGQLYIHPTLTTESLPDVDIFGGSNFTLQDCTAGDESVSSYTGPAAGGTSASQASRTRASCSSASNALLGTVIPPVRSARINTKNKVSLRYGRIQVRAKLPAGDWLWPSVWMLPLEEAYGKWPMSGEISLLSSRGNSPAYTSPNNPHAQGRNYVRSSLNYGPLPSLFTQIFGWWGVKRGGFDRGFHTYTLEWTPEFIRMFVDKRIWATLEVDGLRSDKKNPFARGKYPQVASNWTADGQGGDDMVVVQNIYEQAGGARDAPFDREFYLIISLAAGGTSGWFPDGIGGKPWYDLSASAMRDFAGVQDRWSSTWGGVDDRSLRVDSVKVWSLCR